MLQLALTHVLAERARDTGYVDLVGTSLVSVWSLINLAFPNTGPQELRNIKLLEWLLLCYSDW